jgi:hypothetical protein
MCNILESRIMLRFPCYVNNCLHYWTYFVLHTRKETVPLWTTASLQPYRTTHMTRDPPQPWIIIFLSPAVINHLVLTLLPPEGLLRQLTDRATSVGHLPPQQRELIVPKTDHLLPVKQTRESNTPKHETAFPELVSTFKGFSSQNSRYPSFALQWQFVNLFWVLFILQEYWGEGRNVFTLSHSVHSRCEILYIEICSYKATGLNSTEHCTIPLLWIKVNLSLCLIN